MGVMGGVLESFGAWYAREHPRLVSAMTIVAGNIDAAVEATDEACARACERWARVSRMESPGGWAYTTALNVLRRRDRRRRLEERLLRRTTPTAENPRPDWSVEVWDSLRALPPRERTAVALRYVGDLSNEDVATVMGIAPGTVAAMLHSARSRLAATIGEQTEAEVSDA
jgi:RNA polymerase sigma factor (sigma-70 family)